LGLKRIALECLSLEMLRRMTKTIRSTLTQQQKLKWASIILLSTIALSVTQFGCYQEYEFDFSRLHFRMWLALAQKLTTWVITFSTPTPSALSILLFMTAKPFYCKSTSRRGIGCIARGNISAFEVRPACCHAVG
jgi:hypothetical protein